ncbi:MAG: tetratricopeptide repeat protein [Persephonella sp.]|nr:tetratricopeptide repeat protein [Persephonella sp.]
MLYKSCKDKSFLLYRLADLGNTYLDKGLFEQSVKAFKKAVKLNKNCGECYIDMGIALKEMEKYEAAIQCYQKASQINPDIKGLALYNTACIYAIQGKNKKAKELLEEAFKLDKTLIEYAKTDPEVKHLIFS